MLDEFGDSDTQLTGDDATPLLEVMAILCGAIWKHVGDVADTKYFYF